MSGFEPLLAFGGQAVTAVGSLTQGIYQARVAKNNARIAEENAKRASDAAQEEQKRSDYEYAALAGDQIAAQASSGLDILGRTQQLTRIQTERVRGIAAQDIWDEGTTRSRNALQEAANMRGAARQLRTGAWLKFGADVTNIVTGNMGGKGISSPEFQGTIAGSARSTRRRQG